MAAAENGTADKTEGIIRVPVMEAHHVCVHHYVLSLRTILMKQFAAVASVFLGTVLVLQF